MYLEKDISETDSYGRLLRYVYVDHVMVNAVLVEEGYAQVSTYPPDVKHVDLFLKLQREAKEERRGLWSAEKKVLLVRLSILFSDVRLVHLTLTSF